MEELLLAIQPQTIWRVIKGGWLFDPEKLRPPESASTTK